MRILDDAPWTGPRTHPLLYRIPEPMGLFESHVYPTLPVFLQEAACWIQGRHTARLRYPPSFHERLDGLRASDHAGPSDIAGYQDEQLRSLIRYVYEYVPHYRDEMRRRKLHPDDFRCRDDLALLPVLTREDVGRLGKRLQSTESAGAKGVTIRTSGSTGSSLSILRSRESIVFQYAVAWRHRARHGVEWGTWQLNFLGRQVVPPGQVRPPYWRWNTPNHMAHISMHHITAEKAPSIVAFINGHHFPLFSGYPSLLHTLGLLVEHLGLGISSPPVLVATSSENLLDTQRTDIARAFGTVVSDHYSASEGCAALSQCEHGSYHEDHEFGILERLDPSPGPGGATTARIVATGLTNRLMPLLRYDTGDLAVWAPADEPCACGRHAPRVLRVDGRLEDYIVTPEGRRIQRCDHIFKETEQVRECQIVQRTPGEIVLRVVARGGYSQRDEDALRRGVHHWLSPELTVAFEYVPDLEREPNGKLRAVKSELGGRRAAAVAQANTPPPGGSP